MDIDWVPLRIHKTRHNYPQDKSSRILFKQKWGDGDMIETLKSKWDDILHYIKEEHEVSDVSFNTWLIPLRLYSVEQGNVVRIIVPDANFLGYIRKI